MKEIEYKKCSLSEATHAKTTTGEVFETYTDGFPNRLRIIVQGYNIFSETWEALGIEPLKKVNREPIEFELTFVQDYGKWFPIHDPNPAYCYPSYKKAKFRCVEILNED